MATINIIVCILANFFYSNVWFFLTQKVYHAELYMYFSLSVFLLLFENYNIQYVYVS